MQDETLEQARPRAVSTLEAVPLVGTLVARILDFCRQMSDKRFE